MRHLTLGLSVAALGMGFALTACGGGTGIRHGAGVTIFRGNPARTGVYPGPRVDHSPEVVWGFEGGGVLAVVRTTCTASPSVKVLNEREALA